MHETESGRAEMGTLGCRLDCVDHKTGLTIGRRTEVGRAVRGLLRRRGVSVVIVEVVLGHATFCCRTNCLTLSIFHSVHRFIRANYYTSTYLCDSVRDELSCFAGLMVLMESCWRLLWSPKCYANDSRESGWGVAVVDWT